MKKLLVIITATLCLQAYAQKTIKSGSREHMAQMEQRLRQLEQQVEVLARAKNDIYRQLDQLNADIYEQKQNTQRALEKATISGTEVDKKIAIAKKEIVDEISTKVSKIVAASASSTSQGNYTTNGNQVGYEHVVQPGETISQIAAAYGVTTKSIMRANNIKDARLLRAGTTLFIPE